MRKVILLLLFAIFWSFSMNAKTIHWLTFIDTEDKNVGSADRFTRNLLYARWIEVVNAVLKDNGYSVDIHDVYGNTLTPEKCKNEVNNLSCNSDDIVVFYYIGHGTENTDTSKFPLMFMGQSNWNKLVPLSWVHDTLKRKGARLTITIGMCCNARQNATGRVSPSFAANFGNAYVDSEMENCIKKMFLNYSGNLIATSASPAESSWTCAYDENNMTDYFSFNLVDLFTTSLPDASNPSWEMLLRKIKEIVYEDVKNNPYIQRKYPGTTQTPMWESNLSSADSPRKTPPAPPVVQDDLAALNKIFAYMSSTSVSETERLQVATKVEKMLPSNMIVKIMSQDGNVVVDKETLSRYLYRIASSRLLMNVSVVSLSSTGTPSMKVREVYKK